MTTTRRKPKTLAEWVATCGKTQGEIASTLGISEGHLSHLIYGGRQPSLPLAVRISELTGVPIESLLQAVAS